MSGGSGKNRIYGMYVKRFLDIVCALAALAVFSWLFALVALLVRIKLGSPVLFKQPRPGMIDPKTGKERIFDIYKFRTMTDEKDACGKLLPDEVRLTSFGKKLRATSLDEIPEALNILRGDMSVIGPRPQLVKDMVFMTPEQRRRHTVKPGLSGLAQVSGRNDITWEDKLKWDLIYVDNVSFFRDVRILVMTVLQVFVRSDITQSSAQIDLTSDLGDALLEKGSVTKEEYAKRMKEAGRILDERNKSR